jgi:hypothetical protein
MTMYRSQTIVFDRYIVITVLYTIYDASHVFLLATSNTTLAESCFLVTKVCSPSMVNVFFPWM